MPRFYTPEAVEACFQFYLRFNGQQHDRIETEMRRTWPGWSKQNLYSRGNKIGWIEKYGWEAALKQKLAISTEQGTLTADEELIRDVEQIRKRVKAQLDARGAQGGRLDRDLVWQFRDFCKLVIEARTKLQGKSDTLGGFVTFWERLLDWLPEIDARAARELLKVSDAVLERAAAEYGEESPATDGGTKS